MTHDADRELESLLRRYRPANPDPGLRGRVLATGRARAGARGGNGLFWWAMAASLLIGASLAQISASATTFADRHGTDPQATRRLAAEIREALPEISEEEAGLLSLRLASAGDLIALPPVSGRTATLNTGVPQ